MSIVYTVTVTEVTRAGSDLHREVREIRRFLSEDEAVDWALSQSFHTKGGGWCSSYIDRLPASSWRGKQAAA